MPFGAAHSFGDRHRVLGPALRGEQQAFGGDLSGYANAKEDAHP
jgi:hypothetical protein